MFLCHPLLEVLAGRGIEDIDAFLQTPSWSDLPDPFSISSMEPVVDRILAAVARKERIAVFGDYDCDGVLGAHILRGVLKSLGAEARVYLPHRDEGYGLNAPAVHQFSLSGTDLLITVDNGINARAAVRLAQRLGIEVIVIDHHRVQDRAETLSVWSDRFCGDRAGCHGCLGPDPTRRVEGFGSRATDRAGQPVRSHRVDRGLCPLVQGAHERWHDLA